MEKEESLNTLKQIGVSGTDWQLETLLRNSNYNVETALNRYYDHGLPPEATTPKCAHGNGPECQWCASSAAPAVGRRGHGHFPLNERVEPKQSRCKHGNGPECPTCAADASVSASQGSTHKATTDGRSPPPSGQPKRPPGNGTEAVAEGVSSHSQSTWVCL